MKIIKSEPVIIPKPKVPKFRSHPGRRRPGRVLSFTHRGIQKDNQLEKLEKRNIKNFKQKVKVTGALSGLVREAGKEESEKSCVPLTSSQALMKSLKSSWKNKIDQLSGRNSKHKLRPLKFSNNSNKYFQDVTAILMRIYLLRPSHFVILVIQLIIEVKFEDGDKI